MEPSAVSWWRNRRRASVGAVAALAAFAAIAVLALTGTGGAASAPLPLASVTALGPLRPVGAVGPLGPEGVPVPEARGLAGTRQLAPGEQIDRIACQAGEQVLFHIHAHLTIFVHGVARQVPAGIGIAPPRQVAATPQGSFAAAGACFMWLHTHAADHPH